MLKKSSGAGGETEADLPCPCRQLSLNCNVSRNHFLDPTRQVVVCICLYLILVCVFVQFLWIFLFRKSGKDDDEGVVEDEATWDWQSVVVPASPNKVWYACYIVRPDQPKLAKIHYLEALSKRPLPADILTVKSGAALCLQPNLPC